MARVYFSTGHIRKKVRLIRHRTMKAAEARIAKLEKSDPQGVARGDYFIDAPESYRGPKRPEKRAYTFTPGPWGIASREDVLRSRYRYSVIDPSSDNEDVLAEVDPDDTRAELGQSAKANAQLMAAAPSLLSTLCEELEALTTWRKIAALPRDVKEGMDISLDKIRRAINNAR